MKETKKVVKLSKFLSLVLRHKPETIGLQLDEAGWADIKTLIHKMKQNNRFIDFETLEEVVRTNNKKRFAFNEDKTRIRANQGHSIKIEHGFEAQTPPEILYHGTATKNIESIMSNGLDKRNRHHVHLSSDLNTAIAVGKRHGKPVVFLVDAKAMNSKGYEFFVSENGVWLTEGVPAQYLKIKD